MAKCDSCGEKFLSCPGPQPDKCEVAALRAEVSRLKHEAANDPLVAENYRLRAEVERLTALANANLHPHRADGTIACGGCGQVIASDGIVQALGDALAEVERLRAWIQRWSAPESSGFAEHGKEA